MIRQLVLFVAVGMLFGCAAGPRPEAKVEVHESTIPVAVKCAVKAPEPPAFVDTPEAVAKAPDIFAVSKLRMQSLAQHIGYEVELVAANSACR